MEGHAGPPPRQRSRRGSPTLAVGEILLLAGFRARRPYRGRVRVLFVAQSDPRGSVHRLARVLREQSVADARVMMLSEPRRGDPHYDLARLHDGGQELEELLRTADVLHLVDLVPSQLPIVQSIVARRSIAPRWVLQWDRAPFRTELREINDLGRIADLCTIATRSGILEDADAFVPPMVPIWRPPWTPVLPGTHLRTRRASAAIFASTPGSLQEDPRLEALIDRAENVASVCPNRHLEVLTGRPHVQVLQRQRRSQLVLAAAQHGLPTSALEALAQGLRVVVDAPPEDLAAYALLAGGTPAPVLLPEDLPEAIADLDPSADPDEGAIAWARCVLDPRRWLGVCLRLYNRPPFARAA
jgi:hypothetical protein